MASSPAKQQRLVQGMEGHPQGIKEERRRGVMSLKRAEQPRPGLLWLNRGGILLVILWRSMSSKTGI